MDINLILLIIQSVMVFITVVYVILIYITIRSNEKINQRILFNEIVQQERELRITLLEIRDKINNEDLPEEKRQNSKKDYDTLLFNYYEYLTFCIKRNFIDINEAKIFFKYYLISVKDLFDKSSLFNEGYAEKEQYPGLLWLFNYWKI